MEAEVNRVSIAVDDLGSGLWSGRVKQELEARTPLRNVLFSPSPSRPAVLVEELPIRFLDARSDPQLARLRQLSHSPAAWFRSPFVLVVLVSCPDYEEYKRDVRLRLKAMADTEMLAPGQPELLFVYVRPAAADTTAKGPARLFEAMKKDLNKTKRERCVRLDPPLVLATQPNASTILGLEEFDRQARDALRAAFEARAAAYADEVRRLMLNRLDPSWSFSTLFLVKDGLAAMLEAAGLAEDALREYSELEACYLEVLRSGQLQARQEFGGKPAGEDEAAQLWSSWAATRQAASQPELPSQYLMRQALFASQARLLLKLHRHAEVAERGLKFVSGFGELLAQQERGGGVPPQLREAWCFASYLSLAETTSRLQAARAEERRKADHLGRPGGRRGRTSEVAPGTPHAGGATPPWPSWEWDSASQRPRPSLTIASPLASSTPAGHTGLQIKVRPSPEAEGVASPVCAGTASGHEMQMDWQLGALPFNFATTTAAGTGASDSGPSGLSPPGDGAVPTAAPGSAGLYCLLAKLYSAARTELLRLGLMAGLEVPDCAAAAGLRTEPHPAANPAAAAVEVTEAEQAAAPHLADSLHQPAAFLRSGRSTSDLNHVDLDSSSSEQQQRRQRRRQAAGEPPADEQGFGPVTLVSAPEVQVESNWEADQQQQSSKAPPGNVPHLSVRPKAPEVDGESPSPSPRSASTYQSSITSSRNESACTLLGVPKASAGGPPSARTEQNDMRTVERQVVSALADRASHASAGHLHAPKVPMSPAAAGAAGAFLPAWLVHWRLRSALSSQQLFIELFVELSEAAARCYSHCGHLRSATLLRADVADALVKQGSLQRAATLYEGQCRTFLQEGWHALAAQVLPRLAACQLACGSPGLAHTAAALLSLPEPCRGTPAERQAACQLLLQAAQTAEGLAGCRPLLPAGPPPAGLLPETVVTLTAAIAAAPPKAAVSRFFGRAGLSGGIPLLVPPPGSAEGGALGAAVGDALAVQLVVNNQLPHALPLRDLVLTLAVLQEMTVIHSPRGAPSPVMVLGSGSRQAHSGSSATPMGNKLGILSMGLELQGSSAQERYESQWQQVEELHCPLVAISATAGGVPGGAGEGGGRAPRLQPLSGETLLPPGASVLTFLAAPVKRGLYKALHLRACLHQLLLLVAVQPPVPLWQHHGGGVHGGRSGGAAAAGSRRGSRAGTEGGSPLAPERQGSPHSAEAIVMLVEQAQPRVQLRLLAAGGSLIAGQEQWLGLALAPERDALHSAQLEVTWPLGHLGSEGLGLPAVPRKGTVLGPCHRVVHSHGGDMRLGCNSTAALQASLAAPPPYVLPEHRTTALIRTGGSSADSAGSVPAVEMLPAECPVGRSAAWLMAEGLQQLLTLPLVEMGRPVNLWWRVTAGEVPAPPEQVHIGPPAPRHSTRQHDMRRLGLPADASSLPAAVLDVPVTLEYVSGCQRSHSRVLGAAVRQPFSVTSVARELPFGGVAVQCTLTSNMAMPAQLSRLTLEPQPGFHVTASLLDNMGLLPARLAPFAILAASFLLVPDPTIGPGADFTLLPASKLQPSALAVEYSIDGRQQCGVVVAAPVASAATGSSERGREHKTGGGSPAAGAQGADISSAAVAAADGHTPGLVVLELLDASGRQRSGSPLASPTNRSTSPTALTGEVEESKGSSSRQHYFFRHLLTLEMPASEEDTNGALVYVRQLGPFVAIVGQPTTLCWRLERSGSPDPQQPATRIGFEVQAEADHWRPLGRRYGGVTLAGHDGAVATIEATWVPLAGGTLPVPTLRLQDVNFQEVFDVGLSLSGTNAITVVEAY